MSGGLRRVLVGITTTTLLGVAALAPAEPAVPPDLWRAAGLTRLTPVRAPGVALVDLQGGRATLDEFRGRVVLVYFWATW
ncbi:MAG: hypothetical protein HY216_06750 [Candidatus Rokubacteria bacterium]|nr:hypothetical protein [Candidatus Rokubacteria bacterium]